MGLAVPLGLLLGACGSDHPREFEFTDEEVLSDSDEYFRGFKAGMKAAHQGTESLALSDLKDWHVFVSPSGVTLECFGSSDVLGGYNIDADCVVAR